MQVVEQAKDVQELTTRFKEAYTASVIQPLCHELGELPRAELLRVHREAQALSFRLDVVGVDHFVAVTVMGMAEAILVTRHGYKM